MIDPTGFIAVGLAGFLAGMAMRGKETSQTMRSAAAAGAFVVDDRAYLVTPMPTDDGEDVDGGDDA